MPIVLQPLPRILMLQVEVDDDEPRSGWNADEGIRAGRPPLVDDVRVNGGVLEPIRRQRPLVLAAGEDWKPFVGEFQGFSPGTNILSIFIARGAGLVYVAHVFDPFAGTTPIVAGIFLCRRPVLG
jgi:hypothetical protein